MKKIIIIIVAIIIICQSAVSAALRQQFIAEKTDYSLQIYGEEQNFKLPIVNINDRTYVPLEEFVRKFNYAVNWNVDNKTINIFEDKTRVSQEGVLDNGKKYHFYGTNDEKFDLKQYLKQYNLMLNYERGKIFAETPQAVAEKIQKYILNDIDVSLDIHYDDTMDEWIVIEILPENAVWLDYWSIDTINRKTGVITHHSFDFNNTTKEYDKYQKNIDWDTAFQEAKEDFVAEEADFNITLNNEVQTFKSPIVTIDDKTYVSLTELSEKFGYAVFWKEDTKNIDIFEDVTFISDEGVLENGMRYHFFGRDEDEFDLTETLNQLKALPFSCDTEYEKKIFAETPCSVAEQIQPYIQQSTDVLLEIHYDVQTDTWIIDGKWPEDYVLIGGRGFFTINRKTGQLVNHTNGLK